MHVDVCCQGDRTQNQVPHVTLEAKTSVDRCCISQAQCMPGPLASRILKTSDASDHTVLAPNRPLRKAVQGSSLKSNPAVSHSPRAALDLQTSIATTITQPIFNCLFVTSNATYDSTVQLRISPRTVGFGTCRHRLLCLLASQ